MEERDRAGVLTPEGIFEAWSVKGYFGLLEHRISLIDCVSGNTYDLCEIARSRVLRKKIEGE